MRIVNLCQHEINAVNRDGRPVLSLPPSGQVARVKATPGEVVDSVDGCPILGPTTYGQLTGLPEPAPDTLYVVSGMVLESLRGSRPDVLAPGELVRDDKGQPVGCLGLRRG